MNEIISKIICANCYMKKYTILNFNEYNDHMLSHIDETSKCCKIPDYRFFRKEYYMVIEGKDQKEYYMVIEGKD